MSHFNLRLDTTPPTFTLQAATRVGGVLEVPFSTDEPGVYLAEIVGVGPMEVTPGLLRRAGAPSAGVVRVYLRDDVLNSATVDASYVFSSSVPRVHSGAGFASLPLHTHDGNSWTPSTTRRHDGQTWV